MLYKIVIGRKFSTLSRLVSVDYYQSMGKSLTFRGAVYEAQDILKHHRCKDPICDTHLWKVKHELDLARMKIRQLYKEMEAHGIKPSRRKRKSPLRWGVRLGERGPTSQKIRSHPDRNFDLEFLSSADLVKPKDISFGNCISLTDYKNCYSEPYSIYRPYDSAYTKEVAEMETVL